MRAWKRKIRQPATLNFFQQGDDLPLFSGVPITVIPTLPVLPELPEIPPSLFQPKCNVCLDTGVVGDKHCWCLAGAALHSEEKGNEVNDGNSVR